MGDTTLVDNKVEAEVHQNLSLLFAKSTLPRNSKVARRPLHPGPWAFGLARTSLVDSCMDQASSGLGQISRKLYNFAPCNCRFLKVGCCCLFPVSESFSVDCWPVALGLLYLLWISDNVPSKILVSMFRLTGAFRVRGETYSDLH
jgi:hypothetical protein